MTEAHARTDDPWTSWAAARSLGDIRPRQAAILHVLERCGALTLEQIVDQYRQFRYGTIHTADGYVTASYPTQSDSSIRSRTAELVDAGLVEDTGHVALTRSGRKARLLRAVKPGGSR